MGTELKDRQEADMCEEEWYVYAVSMTWFRIVRRNYIPIAIKDILTVAIESRHLMTIKLNNREMEQCVAKWRGLPVSYHNDQLNVAELGYSLQENTWRSCLQLGGLLTLQEADAIQSLILASAEQAGETLNLQDWVSAYILNWMDNEFSHHKAILRTIKNTVADIPLPFPVTSNWNRTVSSWSILDDKVTDATGALERWCVQKWGAGNIGNWTDLQEENTTHLRHADKLLFWAKRAWFITWAGTIDYLPPIGCELILAIITEKVEQRDEVTPEEEMLKAWRTLTRDYHNDQLNLCRFYSALGMNIFAEGLKLRELKPGYAHALAKLIWSEAEESETLLATSYARILKGKTAGTVEKQMVNPGVEEDECRAPKRDNNIEDLEGKSVRVNKAPLDCNEMLCEGERWRSVILLRNDYYTVALNKTKGLHRWCEGKWGDEHMSYSEILEYKDDGLTQRHRLVYWLLRVWQTYNPCPTFDIPFVYEDILKRVVRDWSRPAAWKSSGDQDCAMKKWRSLAPVYHVDQLGMCDFYAKADVIFFLKGLEIGDFLTSAEAAHVASVIWEGEGDCPDGVMTGEHLRGFYTAALENRMKISEGRASFFKKLRPSQKIGGGAENWVRRKGERERVTKHKHLDESRGVPMLQPGVCTRQVANDTGGRVGVAKSTLRNAGDGAYVLKGFKENEKICRYKGNLLKTRAEINEASLTSEYVLEYHGIAIDARDAGTCTSRFINDALDREAWNSEFRLVGDEVWVFAIRKIEK
jgi:hypothetical protein